MSSPAPLLLRSPAPLLSAAIALWLATSSNAADRLVLRDFAVIRDAQVASLDADGIVLGRERPGGSKLIRWDEVERITLDDPARQTEAEKLLKSIGDPLYRLRVRLEIGDDAGLLAPAAALAQTFRDRQSVSALMVLQSLVWGRIANGQREAALEPWLRAFELLRSRAVRLADLPGSRKPRVDVEGLLGELEPVWFDAAAAKEALPGAQATLQSLADPVPRGAQLYVAALALAAGDMAAAETLLGIDAEPGTSAARLSEILLAQRHLLAKQPQAAIDRLAKVSREVSSDTKHSFLEPLAWYWLGQAQWASDDRAVQSAGLLTLMRIPALAGEESPELAAAALHAVAEAYAEDPALSARLKAEIRRQFAGTWHARHLAAKVASPR